LRDYLEGIESMQWRIPAIILPCDLTPVTGAAAEMFQTTSQRKLIQVLMPQNNQIINYLTIFLENSRMVLRFSKDYISVKGNLEKLKNYIHGKLSSFPIEIKLRKRGLDEVYV
jgi:hypothetical protein